MARGGLRVGQIGGPVKSNGVSAGRACADGLEGPDTSRAIAGNTIAYVTIFACPWPILSHKTILSKSR
jgi:hypothetical protein